MRLQDKVYYDDKSSIKSGIITGLSSSRVIVDHNVILDPLEVYSSPQEIELKRLEYKQNLMQRYRDKVDDLLKKIEKLHIYYQYNYDRTEIISKIESE